ncbi:hypothetical protein [Flavobacterium silvaticum]|uniref:Cytochrome c-552/4 domain-containing protein n=1 Tax=Flavobacterium silvaticum TaxID=1852020 RepID=A0A972FJA2_9FLAO|nr:hypothetical protein [Flavobacterium silvaticum]NMH26702.1 hypothetical protein [Flavobacterium silvaticum]
MQIVSSYRKFISKALLVFSIASFLSCSEKASEYFDPRGTDYAGPNECTSCHKQIHDDFIHTGHFNSTADVRLSEFEKFHKNGALFTFGSGESIALAQADSTLDLEVMQHGKMIQSYALDMVFGFRHAQTFGSWNKKKLYEMPVSYYIGEKQWGTSPGYPSDKPFFERSIPKDCFACHTSNAAERPLTTRSDQRNMVNMEMTDDIDPKTVVHGIDCERCHGPGKSHAKSPVKGSIACFSQLTRQQRLDACAVCHSGNDGMKMKSRFEFRPGDAMSNFYSPSPNTEYDVHGNQYGLLTQSNCFQKSRTMDCMTCHNPHKDKPANDKMYNQTCMGCHAAPKHSPETIASNPSNCIGCHMPAQQSRAVKYKLNGETLTRSYQLRTHRIGLYPESSNPK